VDEMNEIYVTVNGNVVGDPQVRATRAGVPFVTFRLASNVRRLNRETGEYVDAEANFVSVSAFRSLGINLANSIKKGDPLVVYGRLRVNQWDNGERSGTSVEVEAYSAGFDLTRGEASFEKVARPQLRSAGQLGDPAVQEAREQVEGLAGTGGGDHVPEGGGHGQTDGVDPVGGLEMPEPVGA
jgi:single-strand DNA-binding protein